ncbi:hypothetical protein CG709_08795, partial [Lachnotalea glycerini]
MDRKGILIVISGFSGAGKGTLVKGLMSRYTNYAFSISATTRKPRAGEENGVEYFFKTREEFMNMIDNNELLFLIHIFYFSFFFFFSYAVFSLLFIIFFL